MLSLSSERGKLIVIGVLVLGLTALVSSASVQNHPFSEIFPPDENLGFGGNDIENVSRVEMSEIVPDGTDITFRDSGDTPTLIWDESAGEWRLNGVNLNASGNSITNLDSLDGGNSAVNINNVLAMNSNSINGLNNLDFNGGTTYIVQNSDGGNIFVQADDSSGNRNNFVRIDPDNQITAFPTGNVRVVNGNLDLNGNNITNFFASPCPSGEVIADIGDDGSFQCVSMSDEVSSDYVTRTGDSMTGNLDMTGNNILDVGDIQGSGIVSANELASNAVTAAGGHLNSSVAGTFLSETSGALDVQSGSMTWSDLGIAQSDVLNTANDLDSNGDLQSGVVTNTEIANGGSFTLNGLTLNGALNTNGNTLNLDGGDQYITIHDGNGNFNIKSGVDPNQNIVSGSGGTHVRLDENGGFDVSVDESTAEGNAMGEDIGFSVNGGGVEVRGANLNMNGNSITNHYGSACPSGEAMVDVNSDGTYQCTDISNEVSGDYVSRTGDSMTGNLDMTGNNVDNVSTVNSGGVTLNTGGDIVSSGVVRASASLETDSGTVTTSGTGMCIGDQC